MDRDALRLRVTELSATYRVVRPFRLPYHTESLVHGVFGEALRQVGCPAGPSTCPGPCQRPAACAYARLFSPRVPDPSPHPLLRPGSDAPQPLVPLLLQHRGDLAEGETLRVGLHVFGDPGPGDRALLRETLAHMADHPWVDREAGRVALTQVLERAPIDLCVTEGPEADLRLRLRLLTPTRVQQDGGLVQDLGLDALVVAAFRRLTRLCALYGAVEGGDQRLLARLRQRAAAARLVERHLRAQSWERHSRRKDVRYPMRGLVGVLVCEGALGPLLPLLQAAALVHVGKDAHFGLGRIGVEVG